MVFRLTSSKPSYPTELEATKMFPTVKPNWAQIAPSTPSDKLSITWAGHATTYVIMSAGLRVLTDPVFSNRCSPSQFFGPHRYVPPLFEIDDAPVPHLVLISHDHYDHLDFNSIQKLEEHASKSNIKPIYVFGLGHRDLFKASMSPPIEDSRLVELDWWGSFIFEMNSLKATIEFVPAQHWCRRGCLDKNKRLWGGFVIRDCRGKIFYFAGDTGFSEEVFAEIGKRHGPIDVSAIPIGAYDPRWFMHSQHVNPEEAYKIHQLVQSKFTVGIHWGTFILTSEPLTEPKELITTFAATHPNSPFVTLRHGETAYIE